MVVPLPRGSGVRRDGTLTKEVGYFPHAGPSGPLGVTPGLIALYYYLVQLLWRAMLGTRYFYPQQFACLISYI